MAKYVKYASAFDDVEVESEIDDIEMNDVNDVNDQDDAYSEAEYDSYDDDYEKTYRDYNDESSDEDYRVKRCEKDKTFVMSPALLKRAEKSKRCVEQEKCYEAIKGTLKWLEPRDDDCKVDSSVGETLVDCAEYPDVYKAKTPTNNEEKWQVKGPRKPMKFKIPVRILFTDERNQFVRRKLKFDDQVKPKSEEECVREYTSGSILSDKTPSSINLRPVTKRCEKKFSHDRDRCEFDHTPQCFDGVLCNKSNCRYLHDINVKKTFAENVKVAASKRDQREYENKKMEQRNKCINQRGTQRGNQQNNRRELNINERREHARNNSRAQGDQAKRREQEQRYESRQEQRHNAERYQQRRDGEEKIVYSVSNQPIKFMPRRVRTRVADTRHSRLSGERLSKDSLNKNDDCDDMKKVVYKRRPGCV